MSVPALVTDVHLRAAVAAVRALGAAGVEVLAHASHRAAAGRFSRHVDARPLGPAPDLDSARFVESIVAVAAGRGPIVVLPGSEAALDALIPILAAPPEGILLPFGNASALAELRDKGRLAELARGAGILTPRVVAEAIAGESPPNVAFPCLAKPAVPESRPGQTLIMRSRSELAALLDRLPAGSRLLLQEQLEGPLLSLALVVDREGRVVERFQAVASRTFPKGAGPSSAAVSVAPDEELIRLAAGMVADCGLFGLVQLQFVATERGPAVIDANPRCFGSLPLAVACGANLPAAWHGLATGENPAGQRPRARPSAYRIGMRYRWLEADIVTALQGHPAGLLRPRPGSAVGAMWQRGDPIPSLILATSAAAGYLRRAVRRA